MMKPMFKPGDLVIFRKQKHSTAPGPRAREVEPAPLGEEYTYVVDKFWVVVEWRDGKVLLRTRRGKEHLISVDHPGLRRAHWWERLIYRHRFPSLGN